MSGAAEVDVVVPVLNGGPRFRECLAALTAQENVGANIVVVDNGSTDGSLEVARSFRGVEVIVEHRPGSYAARNAGAAAGSSPVLAFTDADCVPSPDWLRQGLHALGNSGAELAAGRVDHEPSTTRAGQYDARVYLDQARWVAELGMAATANLFVRRSTFERLGGFDHHLRSGGDWDLCRRARQSGERLVYAAGAAVVHEPRHRLSELLAKSWRVGRSSGVVMAGDRALLRWGLSPLRLVPSRRVMQESPAAGIIAINLLDKWVAYAGRLTSLGAALLGSLRAAARGSARSR